MRYSICMCIYTQISKSLRLDTTLSVVVIHQTLSDFPVALDERSIEQKYY